MSDSAAPDASRAIRNAAALVILLGAALRLAGLTAWPFEQDELYTIHEATALFDSRLAPGIHARPLWFLLLHGWLAIHEPTAAWLRLPACLFGVAGVWLTWHFTRRFLGDIAGLTATVLVAVSPWHLHASGFARYWAFIYVVALATYLLLLRAYERDRPRAYLAALVPLIAGTATHPSFVFPVVGFTLALTLVRRDGSVGWSWPSPTAWRWLWIPYALALMAGFATLQLIGHAGAVRNLAGRGLIPSLRLVPAMVEWLTPVLSAAGFAGAVALAAQRGDPGRRRFGAAALLGAAGAWLLLALATTKTNIYADYGMATLPLLFAAAGGLVALGTERFPAGKSRTAAIAIALLVLLGGVLPSTVSHLSDGTRFDYRPAFAVIAREAPDVAVVTQPIIVQRHYAPDVRAFELRPRLPLDSLLAAEHRLWFVIPVQRYGIVGDNAGRLRAWLFAHCRLRAAFERPRLDYRMYRTELHSCPA